MPGAALKRPRRAAASPPPASRARRRARNAAPPPPAAAEPSAAAAAAPPPLPPYRLEFSASDPPSAALAPFLARHRGRIGGVHVANKDKADRLLERGAALARALLAPPPPPADEAATAPPPTAAATALAPPLPTRPSAAVAAAPPAARDDDQDDDDGCPVCLHYSLKLQGRGDDAVRRLAAFLRAAARQRCSVLLVSGGGRPQARPKGQLSTVEVLERLAAHLEREGRGAAAAAAGGETAPRARGASRAAAAPAAAAAAAAAATSAPPAAPHLPPLYVAFNPYFPDPHDRRAERDRLRAKLATGLVTGGVALQFGGDAGLADAALAFLRRPDVLGPRGRVLGSVFVPTKRFLAQMRFRPWYGVFLGGGGGGGGGRAETGEAGAGGRDERVDGKKDEGGFLSSVEAAERATAALLRQYRAHGATPLVETAAGDDDSLGRAEALLMRGMEGSEDGGGGE